MERQSYKSLQYSHIVNASREAIRYIKDRRAGTEVSLQTRWSKFNRLCMGGIEPNTILSFAGISGSGKSAFLNLLETDIIDLNRGQDIVVLSFNWEMIGYRQVGRKLSNRLGITTSDLYSGYNKLPIDDYNRVVAEALKIKDYPIYYVDETGTADDVYNTVIDFANKFKDKWIIITLDHTILTKGASAQKEREIISDLELTFMKIKKLSWFRKTIIQLSQMNRDIEKPDRIVEPKLHYPIRSDLFGSDSVYQASDYVFVIHRPELLGINQYGVNRLDSDNKIFLHVIKNRDGEMGIIMFENRLKYNDIVQL